MLEVCAFVLYTYMQDMYPFSDTSSVSSSVSRTLVSKV